MAGTLPLNLSRRKKLMTSKNIEKLQIIIQKINEMDAQISSYLDVIENNDPESIFWMIDERQKMVKYFQVTLGEAIDQSLLNREQMNSYHEFITHILDRDTRIIEKLNVLKNDTNREVAKVKQGQKLLKTYDPSPT
jgi:hypothetical protein